MRWTSPAAIFRERGHGASTGRMGLASQDDGPPSPLPFGAGCPVATRCLSLTQKVWQRRSLRPVQTRSQNNDPPRPSHDHCYRTTRSPG